MPNIETVKYLIKTVQQIMENAINDDGFVGETGEQYNKDINMSEKYISTLKFYNGVEGCISMKKSQNFLSCK